MWNKIIILDFQTRGGNNKTFVNYLKVLKDLANLFPQLMHFLATSSRSLFKMTTYLRCSILQQVIFD